jgi:NADH-quinone oxidoreductase subunit N
MAAPLPLLTLLPELTLVVAGCVVLLLGLADRHEVRRLGPWFTLGGLLVALGISLVDNLLRANATTPPAGNGLFYGSLTVFVRIAALELGALLTLVNWYEARRDERGEFLATLLFALVGLLLVAPADNLFVLFLAVELVSIPSYVLIVLGRWGLPGLEAGTKYFYLGAVSTAVTGYGLSFLYGVSGTPALAATAEAVTHALREPASLAGGVAALGVVLTLGGLLFKIAAVPMHFYIADVYQGASSPVAGFLGFVPKLAGFVAILKIVGLTGLWTGDQSAVYWLLWLVAAASMTVGNVLALRQTNIKRLLAYSGIAHAGYMLVGVLTGPYAGKAISTDGVSVLGDGPAGVLYYTVIYGLANLAAFAVLALLQTSTGPCETLRDVAGLVRRAPIPALVLALAMLSLLGLPPTPGFWGKFALFGSALTASRLTGDTWLIVLVIVALLNSALSAAYYLRVVAAVLVYERDEPACVSAREAQSTGALLCGFLLLILSFYPTGLLRAGQYGARELSTPRLMSETTPSANEVVRAARHFGTVHLPPVRADEPATPVFEEPSRKE